MPSLRDALESALIENPDDLATHCAYADYLQEQGDPRGEFIQLQLALEDPQRTDSDQRRLQRRADELQEAHQRQWLGTLADELIGTIEGRVEYWSERERPYEIRFYRGWLDRIVRRAGNNRYSDLGKLMCQAPITRLLRSLILEYDEGAMEQLIHSRFLGNLRFLQVGSRVGQAENSQRPFQGILVSKFVAKFPRLEQLFFFAAGLGLNYLFSLPTLTALNTLQVGRLDQQNVLGHLASNPALGNLAHLWLRSQARWPSCVDLAGVRAILQSTHLRSMTHLRLHCSDLGDVGCTEIVTSGILKRLKVLDLRHGEISDTGARILADSPDLRRLELLDIERNALTQSGIDALRRVLGPALRADNQQTAEELARRQYLYEED